MLEPIWVAVWDGDGNLVMLGARDFPKHAQSINQILKMYRTLGEDAARKIFGEQPVRLPVLAALTGPNWRSAGWKACATRGRP